MYINIISKIILNKIHTEIINNKLYYLHKKGKYLHLIY